MQLCLRELIPWGSSIQVMRFPPHKVLRSLHLGLTIGLLLSAFLLFASPAQFGSYSLVLKIITALFLLWLSYLGGTGFLFILFLGILSAIYGNVASLLLIQYYLVGFLAGALLAQLYNLFVYGLLLLCCDFKISFIFHKKQLFNVIKSPIKTELHSDLQNDNEQYLYDYKPNPIPQCPYTIVFIANPWLYDSTADKYRKDPIIQDRALFLSSVDKALYSFENDAVLGRPEIWSRIRVVAIFDGELADKKYKGRELLQPYPYMISMDGDKQDNNVLSPIDDVWNKFKTLSAEIVDHVKMESSGDEKSELKTLYDKVINEVDVIFVLSASEKYIRSSAQISDCKDPLTQEIITHKDNVDFEFQIHQSQTTDSSLAPSAGSINIKAQHEIYAVTPGCVALNVLGASLKTYIHEFAHAMSSAVNGDITDEYFDKAEILSGGTAPHNSAFYVNRLERAESINSISAVPRFFVRYNDQKYNSDIDHPSAEENWRGYFPAKKCCSDGCTMDRTYGSYQFDDLISQFMYDRLVVKINRR